MNFQCAVQFDSALMQWPLQEATARGSLALEVIRTVSSVGGIQCARNILVLKFHLEVVCGVSFECSHLLVVRTPPMLRMVVEKQQNSPEACGAAA